MPASAKVKVKEEEKQLHQDKSKEVQEFDSRDSVSESPEVHKPDEPEV